MSKFNFQIKSKDRMSNNILNFGIWHSFDIWILKFEINLTPFFDLSDLPVRCGVIFGVNREVNDG